MANDLIITPENISQIRISYSPDSTAPFAIKNFTSIAVVTVGGQYINIGLQEMLPYIKMLKLKAALAFSTVIAVQSTDPEKYTEIKLDGGVIPSGLVKFVTDGNISLNAIFFPDDSQPPQYLPLVDIFYLPWNSGYYLEPLIGINWGSLDVIQYVDGLPVQSDLGVEVDFDISTFSTDVDEIHISAAQVTINNIAAPTAVPKTFFISTQVGTNYFVSLNGGGASTNTLQKLQNGIIAYNLGANTLGVSETVRADFYKNNILLGSQTIANAAGADGNNHFVSIADAAFNKYDRIDFYIYNGTTGLPVTAIAQSGSAVGICAASEGVFYTTDGNITTGQTVYTDASLGTPLAGADFIVDPNGIIYAIDNVTGVVGAATGNTCDTPITGKNMFVVSTTANQLNVSGFVYPPHGVGDNYNIVIKSDSVITNLSGGYRTFKFYTSPPFIPANVITSAVIADGFGYGLPNDISIYNYLEVAP